MLQWCDLVNQSVEMDVWRACCPSPVKFLEPYDPNQSAASLTLHENDAVHVQSTSGIVKPRRKKTTRTYQADTFDGTYLRYTCDSSGLGGSVRRYLSTRNLRMTSNFFRCTMYTCHTLYSVIVLPVKQHSRKDKKKKDSQMSVYQKADILVGELIQ